MTDNRLPDVVRDLERHAAAAGWDRPPRLYALVEVTELRQEVPELGATLGLQGAQDGDLAALEQPDFPVDKPPVQALAGIAWPEGVAGCVLVMERAVLDPDVEATATPAQLADPDWVAHQTGGDDVRIVAGVLRDGSSAVAVRSKNNDEDAYVIFGEQISPDLTGALLATFSQ